MSHISCALTAVKKRKSPEPTRSEREFLAGYDVSAFARPSLAVDVVLVSIREDALVTLVLERSEHPYRGRAVLPGGFVRMDESLEDAALRVLRDKAGLTPIFLEQLYTFGDVRRDPRTRVISVAYIALVAPERFPGSDGDAQRITARIDVPWAEQTGGPVVLLAADGAPLKVGFDHTEIVGMAVKRLRGKLSYAPIGYQLLPERFTLLELQRVHEVILGRELNKDSFRRKMLASGELEATGRRERDVGHRPAELYRFRQCSAL
jgi:8-oxo-dGTP diphosphatase